MYYVQICLERFSFHMPKAGRFNPMDISASSVKKTDYQGQKIKYINPLTESVTKIEALT